MRHALTLALWVLAAPAVAETSDAEGDPWCDDIAPGEAGGVTCFLPFDTDLLYFLYEETGEPAVWNLRFTQFGFDFSTRAESDPIRVEYVMTAPELRDVTDDGIAELFIPVMSGMVNITWSVWTTTGSGIFVPVGEISGIAVDALEVRDGLIVSATRDNAAVWTETGTRIWPTGMDDIYSLSVNHADRTCEIIAARELASVGLNKDLLIDRCEARDWD
ncbi:hypothetical protein [Histidinibacterium lentulum]|uniref:Uncharacterized protein n=1 Tax=Histidinibacterium lentulum TaxID=2480588 RepID=A0A3N2R671_9RHOB|nr:hypothetical protein [Histidinibacterium lentulum]ROU02898.1 hypothetical protein EAT49_06245 [Histidinibacterium lentulum]